MPPTVTKTFVKSKKIFRRVLHYAFSHKLITVISLVVVLGGGYYAYGALFSSTGETRYVLGVVEKGTIISTVTASGQVSASQQLDIKPKVSGDIVWINAKPGDSVRAGTALMLLDDSDARQSVLSGAQSLEQAKLQLQKDSASAPIDFQKATDAVTTAKSDLSDSYTDAYNALTSAYLDLPTGITTSQNTLYGYDLSPNKGQWNIDIMSDYFDSNQQYTEKVGTFKTAASSDYLNARTLYDKSSLDFKTVTRLANPKVIEATLVSAIETTTAVAQSIQSDLNFIATIMDIAQQQNFTLSATVTTLQSNLKTSLSAVNSDLTTLLARKKALEQAKLAITSAEQNVTLLSVGNPTGTNPISLQISKTSLQDKESNLAQLKKTLAEYTIVAPFDGTIAAVNVKNHESASPGTTVATLITNQKMATLSLNEVDAAKLQLGNKVTLSFDAIEDLTLTGVVAEIDSLGTVSQGVVSYSVKISFDTQDARVKPGMTVNASIQTAVKTDALMVPSSAVKTQSGEHYVLVFTPALTATGGTSGVTSSVAPTQVPVEIGISDDTSIEILSGLTEGEQIVTRTQTSSTQTTTTTTAGNRNGGLGGGAGIRL